MDTQSEGQAWYGPKQGTDERTTLLADKDSTSVTPGWFVALAFVPFLVFVAVCLLFIFLYHVIAPLVWLFVAGGFIVAGLIFLMSASSQTFGGPSSSSRLTMLLALGCMVGLGAGSIVGFKVYRRYLTHYWFTVEAESYANVLPSEPPGAFMSAGKLLFDPDAQIDLTKSIGYRNGSVYCVAPVSDLNPVPAQSGASELGFWAVGVDCCEARGAFTCDDAMDPRARSGIVINDESKMTSSAREHFMQALRQAEAVYQVNAADKPVFVRWVVDPETVERNIFLSGLGVALASAAVYFFLCFLVTICIYSASQSRKSASGGGFYSAA